MAQHRAPKILLAGLLGFLPLAACGGDDDEDATATTLVVTEDGGLESQETDTTGTSILPGGGPAGADAGSSAGGDRPDGEGDAIGGETPEDAVTQIVQRFNEGELGELDQWVIDTVREQARQQLALCFADIAPGASLALEDVTATTEGDTAEAEVRYQVTGGTEGDATKDETWQLRQEFGLWRLSEAPPCPFTEG